jgi:lipopolysaccharide biosynthesis glycosyltransferase
MKEKVVGQCLNRKAGYSQRLFYSQYQAHYYTGSKPWHKLSGRFLRHIPIYVHTDKMYIYIFIYVYFILYRCDLYAT